MKLLLTSAGIKNPSIRAALLELLGKPIEDCTALVISTASYPLRHGPQLAWNFIAGEEPQTPMAELGWKSVGALELTALPSLERAVWVPELEEADVLLVNGGDTIYLDRWMRESGLAELLPRQSRSAGEHHGRRGPASLATVPRAALPLDRWHVGCLRWTRPGSTSWGIGFGGRSRSSSARSSEP